MGEPDLKGRPGRPRTGEKQELCEHLNVMDFRPHPESEFPQHEYSSIVRIRCDECEELFSVEILVN